MYRNRYGNRHNIPATVFAVILAVTLIFSAGSVTALGTETGLPDNVRPIDNYIMVVMEHAYSFPDAPYDAAYFSEEYVARVEPIDVYEAGSLNDKDSFCMSLQLILTDYGCAHIDELIAQLNERVDIRAAERDYLHSDAAADYPAMVSEDGEGKEMKTYAPVFSDGAYVYLPAGTSAQDLLPVLPGRVSAETGDALTNGDILISDLFGEKRVLIIGDADGSGTLTSRDARLILRAAAQLEILAAPQSKAADIDGDGTISAYDARGCLRICAELMIPQMFHRNRQGLYLSAEKTVDAPAFAAALRDAGYTQIDLRRAVNSEEYEIVIELLLPGTTPKAQYNAELDRLKTLLAPLQGVAVISAYNPDEAAWLGPGA